jgi:hypothetical protein
MPDRDLEVDATSVLVEWGPIRLIGPGQLRLTSTAMSLDTAGGMWQASYEEVRGASWRTGSLTVHGESGRAAVESKEGLDLAWVQLVERACPLPELVRDHRLLGSRRGGSVVAQARFLGPLLDARKRIEKEPDLETRVALLDAKQLRDRVVAALGNIASDTFPASQPDRRALEAELEEAMTGFFRQLESVDAAATYFRGSPETIRFTAWREWASRVVDAYAQADGAWAAASRFIPGSHGGQTP